MLRSAVCFLVLGLLGCSTKAAPEQHIAHTTAAWTATATPLRLRARHTATLLGTGEILFAGGSGDASTELFDLRSGRYAAGPSMTAARTAHGAVVLPSGKVLLAGGTGLSSAEIYDPITRTTTATGSMSAVRVGATFTRLSSGKILVVGGGPNSAEIYDEATGTFAATSAKATSAQGTATALPNGKVLIVGDAAELFDPAAGTFAAVAGSKPGGFSTSTLLRDGRVLLTGLTVCGVVGDTISCTMVAQVYDSTKGTFTSVAGDPVSRPSQHATLLPSGKVLISGGAARVSIFDPSTNTWSSGGNMEAARSDHTSTLVPGGDVILFGGSVATVDVYSEADALAVSAGPSLVAAHRYPRATLLLDDRVLVAGGSVGGSTAQLIDVAAGTSTLAGAMKTSHDGQAQVLLSSGKVLLAGGSGSAAELFDPATSSFASTGTMSVARSGATATLLSSGLVLVAGGSPGTAAELYDEKTGTFTTTGAMIEPLSGHGAVLLADGRVLLVGDKSAQLYDPKKGTFAATSTSGARRFGFSASALLSGQVFIGGGTTLAADLYDPKAATLGFTDPISQVKDERPFLATVTGQVAIFGGSSPAHEVTYADVDLFDPLGGKGHGSFRTVAPMPSPLRQHAASMLGNGGSIVIGGNPCSEICVAPDNLSTFVYRDRANDAWRPKITSVAATAAPGSLVTITGTGFRAGTAGGDGSSASSDSNVPIVFWVPAAARSSVLSRVESFTDTTMSWRVPATAYAGKGRVFVWSAGALSAGSPVEIAIAANGAACANDGECGSGFCVDGVCCDTACTGICEACSAARKTSGTDGTCGAIPPGKDSRGLCVLGQGAGCKADIECGTGHCVDGACCDTTCTGQCESCAVTGSVGTCVAVTGKPAGSRPACAVAPSDAPCAQQQCNGIDRTSCAGFVDATTVCQSASCSEGKATLAAKCDGKGACAAGAPIACEPFACGETTCLKTCAGDSECASGYRCAEGKCVTGAVCDGYHTVTTPGGPPAECAPFTCEGDHCRTSCASSSECVAGYVCDGTSCVVPAGAADAGGGCALDGVPSRARGTTTLLLLGALAAVGLLRRRDG